MEQITSQFLEKLNISLNYFEKPENSLGKLWLLSNQSSKSKIFSTIDFEVDNFGVSIIDQFDGRQPWLINHDYVNYVNYSQKNQKYEARCKPTILFDSHIIGNLRDYIHEYDKKLNFRNFEKKKKCVNKPDKIFQKNCINQLLKFITQENFDPNPTFFFIEALVKNKNEDIAHNYARKAAISILRLHTMDEQAFLEDNCIVPDWDKVENYKQRYGINSDVIEDLALVYADNYLKSIDQPFIKLCQNFVNYTYSALLKIILIHKDNIQKPATKLQKLYDFFKQKDGMNIILMREVVMAAYYFSKKLPMFIQIQSNMPFSTVKKKLLQTAWDLFLLRMPEILLSNGTAEEAVLSYVCSRDKLIRKLGRLFTIESIFLPAPSEYAPTGISLKLEELERDLEQEVIDILLTENNRYQNTNLINLPTNTVHPISVESLDELISNLENQVKMFCKNEI